MDEYASICAEEIQQHQTLINQTDTQRGTRRQEPHGRKSKSDKERKEHKEIRGDKRERYGQNLYKGKRQLHRQEGVCKSMEQSKLQGKEN